VRLRWGAALAATLLAVHSAPASAATEPEPTAPLGVPVKSVMYDFGAVLGAEVWDRDHVLPLHTVTVNGGGVTGVPREDGVAVDYPPPCSLEPRMCPRVILESDPAPGLNPDMGDLSWGARVLVEPGRTTDGENVVQKGYSILGTQFKLQVDHYAGLASCVLAGTVGEDHHIYVAKWNRTVADGLWHSLDCVRRSGGLSLLVDGTLRSTRPVPPDLSIVNPDPLRLGGKGLGPWNDQFHGRLDDVYVTVD
jgi:concanavalin A-like lectin/glucanase superfamily protein